jgi:anti-sigma regulatory factor (Ser/Thr protein kinase)
VRVVLGDRHPLLADIALGVSELATNAIQHTPSGDGGKVTVRLVAVGRLIRLEVTNDGTTGSGPLARDDDDAADADDAENGRGLLIVAAIASTWGVVEDTVTTTVWAEFRP